MGSKDCTTPQRGEVAKYSRCGLIKVDNVMCFLFYLLVKGAMSSEIMLADGKKTLQDKCLQSTLLQNH